MGIVLQIASPIFCLAAVVLLVKNSSDYKRRGKSFADFLRLEDDAESLKSIGGVEFYGLESTDTILDAQLQLYKRFNHTKKQEYFDHAEYLEKFRMRRIFLRLLLGVSIVLLGFALLYF